MVARKLVLGLVGLTVLCSMVLMGGVAEAGWHSSSQSYRDSLILNWAWNDYGKNVSPAQCKEWV